MILKSKFGHPSRSIPRSFVLLIISVQGYDSFGLWLLLTFKSTIRIIGGGSMVEIKLEGGGVGKNLKK